MATAAGNFDERTISPTSVLDIFRQATLAAEAQDDPEDQGSEGTLTGAQDTSHVSGTASAAGVRPTGGQAQAQMGTNTKPRGMSQQQRAFMLKVREHIECEKCPDFFQDWTHITPARVLGLNAKRSATCTMEELCLKPMAVWAPHKLDESYIPVCPKCKTNNHVNATNPRWQLNDPKPIYRLGSSGFLDTVTYPCTKCRTSFLGTDLKSLALDKSNIVLRLFHVHMTPRAAIDQKLYEYIIHSPIGQKVSKIQEHLLHQSFACYKNEMTQFLANNNNNSIIQQQKQEKSIVSFAGRRDDTEQHWKGISLKRQEADVAKRSLDAAVQHAYRDISFETMKRTRSKHKTREIAALALGPTNLEKLLSCDILTGKQLLSVAAEKKSKYRALVVKLNTRDAPEKITSWVDCIETLYAGRKARAQSVRQHYNKLKEELEKLLIVSHELTDVSPNPDPVAFEGAAHAEPAPSPKKKLPHPLTRDGYDLRVMSMRMIENVLQSHFVKQKPLLRQNILSLGGTRLRIDTQYKSAKRIVVYDGRQSFRPWIGLTTIMNEYGEVIWWGLLKSPESITEIEPHLRALRARLQRIQKTSDPVLVIAVDNCCNVRKKLQAIFGPRLIVILDPCHWLDRWKDAVRDSKSKEAHMFYALMSSAVLTASNEEFRRVKVELTAKLSKFIDTTCLTDGK
jgi:hypothetical protein